MSLSQSFSNALSGLNVAQRRATVVSANIANATTAGYSRRSLDVATGPLGGVVVQGITRHTNAAVTADRRLADAAVAGGSVTVDMLSRVEAAIGASGDGTSLSDRIAALETSLIDAAANPSSTLLLDDVAANASQLARTLNSQSDTIQSLRVEADSDIAAQVETLNSALGRVQTLNAQISRTQASGADTSALLDERQRAIDDIGAIIPLREVSREGGQVALISTGGMFLLDEKPAEFAFSPTATITADMTVGSGALSGLTVNGRAVQTSAGGRIDGGSLAASFALRDDELPTTQAGLDAIAQDLIARFSGPDADATLAVGAVGLFTDAGLAIDPAQTDGIAARIAVNTALDGASWRLRDGINATGQGASGDASGLLRLSDRLSATTVLPAGGPARSVAGHAANIETTTGNTRVSAEETLGFSTGRWEALKETELADGVDTDQELQSLMQIEEAYAANAKVISALEAMMQTLMEL